MHPQPLRIPRGGLFPHFKSELLCYDMLRQSTYKLQDKCFDFFEKMLHQVGHHIYTVAFDDLKVDFYKYIQR